MGRSQTFGLNNHKINFKLTCYMEYRLLTSDEINILQQQHCYAEDWNTIYVAPSFQPHHILYTKFSGEVKLGVFEREYLLPGGLKVHSGINNATIHNCTIGNNVRIYNVRNYIANYDIDEDSCIENINTLLVDGSTTFGNGVKVPVMNEGGGREIPIFNGLSAQLAYILALYRHRPQLIEKLQLLIDEYAEKQRSKRGYVGKHVNIINCGSIENVYIGDYTNVNGTSLLKNGSINSNQDAPVIIGSGVKCNDFIISSGVEITDSTLVSRCFIGQGCVMGKHYSALDSLFFSNCQGMHGEATAVFAGPYTVSHHKSSLLIAGMFSFLNAGSGSNQSNHMYKLGPIHQGIAERGAKTTSDSYILWPARVGAFTLVMGRHSKHSDTSDLPFSYMIENATESYLVPAVNLRSVGTVRDAQKWPKRDNRKDPNKLDQINFNLLSPYTIQKMFHGQAILRELQSISGKTSEVYVYQNCKIRNSSLRNGIKLYEMGIRKFLGNSLISRLEQREWNTIEEMRAALRPSVAIGLGEWIDLSGMIAPKEVISTLLNQVEEGQVTLQDFQNRIVEIHQSYYEYEWTWAYEKLLARWNKTPDTITIEDLIQTVTEWKTAVIDLDNMLYEDARKEFNLNAQTGFGIDGDENQKHLDFTSVRGSFENNPFVVSVLNHIEVKGALGNKMLTRLQAFQ